MRRVITVLQCVLFLMGWTFLAKAQSSYTGQLSGVVTDSSGGVIPSAKVTLTDEATGIPVSTQTDARGIYVFTGIRPANYAIRVEAPNLAVQERKRLTIAVSQQATLDFVLTPQSISESVSVSAQAPLLDTGNASLGTDVTNEYVRDIPLPDRSFFGLVFLSGGVTETAGQGTTDSYPTGTNFVSNGQRNATAEIRVDGALTSAPEQGEGATSNVYYQPSVEIVQEFKVENNSFSAEFGNNGGTVVNIVLKEGGNQFHGSGWWFGQRSALDANDFFNNAQGIPKPDHSRDQYGFSLGGPIRKEKTFFFVDFEKVKQDNPVEINAFVPTDLERSGDFRNTFVLCTDATQGCTVGQPVQQHIYNPFNVDMNGKRADFTTPNVIDQNRIDAIGQKIINLYPRPTIDNAPAGAFNFHKVVLDSTDSRQFDIKIDHHFNDKNRLSARYSNLHFTENVPTVFGDGDFNDGFNGVTDVHNATLEDNWSPISTIVWTNRFAIDRAVSPVTENYPKLDTVFTDPGDAILGQVNGLTRIPVIQMDNNATSLYNQCCTDTNFAHTLYSYSSALSWVHGRHIFKFGGEQRIFFNNFYQPNPPTGFFHFTQGATEQIVGNGNSIQGNSFASLLLGYGDPSSSSLSVFKSVANKSKETAFYVQDDWKITPKLTVNLGVRYEWSTPYTERNNLIQFSNFSGDSGVSVPIDIPGVVNLTGNLLGTTNFPTSGNRNIPVDRNNVAPRLGFAYTLDNKTVVRGGAGIYYGMSVATNFQFTGTAFGNSHPILFTKDNFQKQFATLANPFPNQYAPPQGTKYGGLALWGFPNNNSLDTSEGRNAEIYQWNLGVQHLFAGNITIGIDYSASRSTHLPYSSFSGTANRNYIPSNLREQISAAQHALDPNCDQDGCVTNYLNQLVTNPFQSLFKQVAGQPAPIFNEPESIYNDDQIPLINLLRPFPQFDGPFSGLTRLSASAWYNSLQVRFQKRASHYVSFEGNYTFSKATDNSSAGANSFITASLSSGIPQVYDNLKAENSVSANDATHRFVLATIVDIPVGRGRWVGHDMNRILDGIAGGWSISTFLTFQTGTPISIVMASPRLADGNQRPSVVCSNVGSGFSYHQAAANGQDLASGANIDPNSASVFNANCFADPGDQIAGNVPRYFSSLRGDGIHNADLSFSKEFAIREGMRLQIRGEFFNFTNTPRFNFPNTSFGDSAFGQVTSTLNTPRHTQIGVRFEF
jgi:hypothetical protein